LNRQLGPIAAAPSATSSAAPAAEAPPASGGAAAEKKPEPEAPAQPSAPPPDEMRLQSPCKSACRALESMRRSATRICEIAGNDNERCTWARQKLSASEERVQRAGCACQSD
jgi:hypothetical protein